LTSVFSNKPFSAQLRTSFPITKYAKHQNRYWGFFPNN
jgi:hypothetical protein